MSLGVHSHEARRSEGAIVPTAPWRLQQIYCIYQLIVAFNRLRLHVGGPSV